jgi:hypothetical protein
MSLFSSRPKLPESFKRWTAVDTLASSECLHEGPSVLEVRTFKRWLDAYERWRGGYDEYLKAVRTLAGSDSFVDDFDRRQCEHYTALFIQSGQWRALLLMLLQDAAASERSRYLAEIDGFLADLRKRIEKP